LHHYVGCQMDKIAGIKKWNDLHSLRQDMIVQLLNFFFVTFQGRVRISSLLQKQCTFHNIRIVDQFSIGIFVSS